MNEIYAQRVKNYDNFVHGLMISIKIARMGAFSAYNSDTL